MVAVSLNQSSCSLLSPLKERAEILDETGRLIGYFEPVEEIVDYAEVRKLFDPEEIKAIKIREGHLPGTPLKVVLERLQAMENSQ